MERSLPQGFFQPITGPAPARDVHQQTETSFPQKDKDVADEATGRPTYLITQAPPKIFAINSIVIPALTDRFMLSLPDNKLDWIAFFCPAVPGATLSIGPNAPTVDLTRIGWLILPVTTFTYLARNTNAAAFTLTWAYGAGYPPPDFR